MHLHGTLAAALAPLVALAACVPGLPPEQFGMGGDDGGRDGSLDTSARSEGGACPCDVQATSDRDDRTDAATTPASCRVEGAGVTSCGAQDDSCCTSPALTGGTYDRTYTTAGGVSSGESDPATVSSLRIDQYLVTVGRFRGFVSAWKGGSGYLPSAGSGKHTHLNGGRGLANSVAPGTYEPGWSASDDANVAPTDDALSSCGAFSTWTASASSADNLPMNCVTWAEAYAFCIWDGGFLPSETEWEYAAAGGSEQLEYPWGEAAPGGDNEYAIYGNGASDCYYPTGALTTCTGVVNIAPVGTAALGAARWGQLDMGGEVVEWNLDGYATYVDPCVDCAYLGAATTRVTRGGNFSDAVTKLAPSSRGGLPPDQRGARGVGFRCARVP